MDSHYSGALVLRRPQKGRASALRDEPSKVKSRLLHFLQNTRFSSKTKALYTSFLTRELCFLCQTFTQIVGEKP